MKSRQDHIDFDRNYCEHYAPQPGSSLKNDYCALGCGASDRMREARQAGAPNMSPCIGGHQYKDVHKLCPKWVRRSVEHAEARADSIENMMKNIGLVMPVVNKWRTWKPNHRVSKAEVIPCPACGGRLHLNQSSYNGHVAGHCETKNCVSGRE